MSGSAAWAGLAVLALILTLGFVELFRLRFARGDVYPYGSSLRADPLGTKALHDALAETPGLTIERNERPLERLVVDPATVVLLLGTPASALAADEADSTPPEVEEIARRGARVVLALRPEDREPWWVAGGSDTPTPTAAQADPKTPSKKRPPASESAFPAIRWVALRADDAGQPTTAVALRARGNEDLPERVPVLTGVVFAEPAAAWRVLYRRDGHPLVIERRIGAGSLVLAADSYLFSNQAVLSDRQALWLAWTLGGARRVVFDESHLGVNEQAGVMVLARRYRLEPFLGALAALAVLFVWRSSSRLVPPPAVEDVHRVAGGDAASGLATLLERGIAKRDLLALCAERWSRDCGRGKQDAVRAVNELGKDAVDPVAGYGRIRDALARLQPGRANRADENRRDTDTDRERDGCRSKPHS